MILTARYERCVARTSYSVIRLYGAQCIMLNRSHVDASQTNRLTKDDARAARPAKVFDMAHHPMLLACVQRHGMIGHRDSVHELHKNTYMRAHLIIALASLPTSGPLAAVALVGRSACG